jgi:hypothetical protein
VIPGEDEARERDTLAETGMRAKRVSPESVGGERLPASAERRARRAWLGDAALSRRAEAAEASVRTLETQLGERELELRRVKQREHAEQQLRVEAEEATARLRRSHRAELDRLRRRAEETHDAARRATRQRDELAARMAAVEESCARLHRGVGALQSLAAGLRTLERERRDALQRVRELEAELGQMRASAPPTRAAGGGQHSEEMAGALAAAVERLRARAGTLEQPPQVASESPPAAPSGQPSRVASESPPAAPSERPSATSEIPVVYVVPRLFPQSAEGSARLGRRLAPAVKRLAARLSAWADRTQDQALQGRPDGRR